MSKQFSDLIELSVRVRDHYRDLQKVDGQKEWGASERMAGFVGDVGALSKLVMAKQGLLRGPENIDEELAHELADNLWSILVLADELGIDLEAAFIKNMDELHARIEAEKRDTTRWKRLS